MRPQCWLVYEGYQSKLALNGSVVSCVGCELCEFGSLSEHISTGLWECGAWARLAGEESCFSATNVMGMRGRGGVVKPARLIFIFCIK